MVRVFVVNSFKMNSGRLLFDDGSSGPHDGAMAIAIVARRDLEMRGNITIDPLVGSALTGCNAGTGVVFEDSYAVGWAGGGANGTDGADGGAAGANSRGAKDVSSGTPGLVPLRGGCSGGFTEATGWSDATGGGAIQLSSGTRITIDGALDAGGVTAKRSRFRSMLRPWAVAAPAEVS